MMRISTRGQYALLIMTELAEQPPAKFIPLKLLSHRHNISVKYLEQILLQLRRSNLIHASKGKNGGYYLKPITAHKESYKREDVWGSYDATGTKYGGARLILDLDTRKFYQSPIIDW